VNRELGDAIAVECCSALETSLSWQNPAELLAPYQGLILGGSGDFDFDGGRAHDDQSRVGSYMLLKQLEPLFTYVFETDFPTFGICFGHQLLGAFAGAEVRHDPVQRKSRSHEVQVVTDSDSALLANVPKSFYAHYGHKDSLDRVPERAHLLVCGGEECRVSALQYSPVIYTTQFHPELTVDDMRKRVNLLPGYLPEGVAVDEVFTNDRVSNTLLHNFARLVEERARIT
jgi:GMP synthase (glutamine-hydrolysing)